MAQKTTAKKTMAEDPHYTQALQSYELGLRAMQEHKFDKAKPHFQKIIGGPSKELADRANVHLNICNQHLERTTATQFKTSEEHFDYAVSLMNVGDYVTAREHLEKLLKQNAKADYVIYGIAALDCLTGHVEDSLRRLDEALRLNAATSLPGAQRFRFPESCRGPAFHRVALPGSWRRARLFRRPGRRRADLASPSRTIQMETKAAELVTAAAACVRGRPARRRHWRRHRAFHAAQRPEAVSFFRPARFLPGALTLTALSFAIFRAVVTVSDDGGSSGRLRKELNMLPPGDIRNCIVALSEDEALLSKLFRHRFDKGSGLEGHSFGNLFLAALTSLTSDFSEAVRLSSEILLTRGHIYPATTSNVELEALMEDGTRVRGETKITASKGRIRELFLVPPDVGPMPQTLEAIANADLITIGPGSLFTSLIPNLLVRGISQAIVDFARHQGLRLQSDDAGQRKPWPDSRRSYPRTESPCAEAAVRLCADQSHASLRTR